MIIDPDITWDDPISSHEAVNDSERSRYVLVTSQSPGLGVWDRWYGDRSLGFLWNFPCVTCFFFIDTNNSLFSNVLYVLS